MRFRVGDDPGCNGNDACITPRRGLVTRLSAVSGSSRDSAAATAGPDEDLAVGRELGLFCRERGQGGRASPCRYMLFCVGLIPCNRSTAAVFSICFLSHSFLCVPPVCESGSGYVSSDLEATNPCMYIYAVSVP